jgi:hypothetical protein
VDNNEIGVFAYGVITICDALVRSYVEDVRTKIVAALGCGDEITARERTFIEEHLRTFYTKIYKDGGLVHKAVDIFQKICETRTCEEPYCLLFTQSSHSAPENVWKLLVEKEDIQVQFFDIIDKLVSVLFKIALVAPKHFHMKIPELPEPYNPTLHDWFSFGKGCTQIAAYAFPALQSDTGNIALKAKVIPLKAK